MGIKVLLLLVTPATVGLATLAGPITAALFERGAFGAADTHATAQALWCYLPGLPAIAIAQLLIFAFYARKNTLIPSLAQGAAIGLYLLTALALLWADAAGLPGLGAGQLGAVDRPYAAAGRAAAARAAAARRAAGRGARQNSAGRRAHGDRDCHAGRPASAGRRWAAAARWRASPSPAGWARCATLG